MQYISFKSSSQMSHIITFDDLFINFIKIVMTLRIIYQFEHFLFYAFENTKTFFKIK